MGEIILAAILIPLLLFWTYEIVGEFTKDDIPMMICMKMSKSI